MYKSILVFVSSLFITITTLNIAMACGCGNNKNDSNVSSEQQAQQQNVVEEKVQCPVMKTWILPNEAADKTEYNGKTYYFCCGGCKEQFLQNPDSYVEPNIKS